MFCVCDCTYKNCYSIKYFTKMCVLRILECQFRGTLFENVQILRYYKTDTCNYIYVHTIRD